MASWLPCARGDTRSTSQPARNNTAIPPVQARRPILSAAGPAKTLPKAPAIEVEAGSYAYGWGIVKCTGDREGRHKGRDIDIGKSQFAVERLRMLATLVFLHNDGRGVCQSQPNQEAH